jgi:protein-S-isoprenylcysteine O-methyltransferase
MSENFVQLDWIRPALFLAIVAFFALVEWSMHRRLHPESDDSNPFWFLVQIGLAVVCPVLENLLFPHFNVFLICTGCVLMAFGLAVRWGAITTADKSFHHFVQTSRDANHSLITHGVYRYIRHPAYFGFYVFAIGTQLFLNNFLSLGVYVIVLFRFFSGRIRNEEKWLVRMFGADYVRYRDTTRTWIPFIP